MPANCEHTGSAVNCSGGDILRRASEGTHALPSATVVGIFFCNGSENLRNAQPSRSDAEPIGQVTLIKSAFWEKEQAHVQLEE